MWRDQTRREDMCSYQKDELYGNFWHLVKDGVWYAYDKHLAQRGDQRRLQKLTYHQATSSDQVASDASSSFALDTALAAAQADAVALDAWNMDQARKRGRRS